MVVMIRALVMLLVLVAVPLFAMFGSSLVDRAKEIAIDTWTTWTDSTAAAATAGSEDAELKDGVADNLAPRFLATNADKLVEIVPADHYGGGQQRLAPPAGKEPIVRGNFHDPAHQNSAQPQHQPPVVDRFGAIQQRLRDLGAVYFRLDRLDGPDGEYRFHCEFDEADEPFTASDADLLQSMQRVLQQAERWKVDRRKTWAPGYRR